LYSFKQRKIFTKNGFYFFWFIDKRRRNMADERMQALWKKGVQLMGEKYTRGDWSKKRDIKRYFKDEIYKDTCFRQLEYVVEK